MGGGGASAEAQVNGVLKRFVNVQIMVSKLWSLCSSCMIGTAKRDGTGIQCVQCNFAEPAMVAIVSREVV